MLSNNAFVYDLDGLFCVWQNEYNAEDSSVDIYLDFFERNGQGGYDRYQESFAEQAYSRELLRQCLNKAGFEVLGEYDGYTDAPPAEDSERIVYVVRKINS